MEEAVRFEGFEKRLELEFVPDSPEEFRSGDYCNGLRALSREVLNSIVAAAQCTVVSELSNDFCDSYVLSESSLFVYPLKIVIKTCGKTQLLLAISPLLEAVAALQVKLTVERCTYSRGSFMFPSLQRYPHGNFDDEVEYLQSFFGHMGSGGKAYVLGTLRHWHIYVATTSEEADLLTESFILVHEPTYTLDMCMTELDRSKALKFFNEDGSLSGYDMTKNSAIDKIFPNAEICDYSFSPCGYSMNALELNAHSTIHVTPEAEYSYASYEFMGYGPICTSLQTLLGRVLAVFEPQRFSVSLQASNGFQVLSSGGSWNEVVVPEGYICEETTREEMPCGSVHVFHVFKAVAVAGEALLSAPVRPLPLGQKSSHVGPHQSAVVRAQTDQRHHQDQRREESYVRSLIQPSVEAPEVCSRRFRRKFQDMLSALSPGPAPTSYAAACTGAIESARSGLEMDHDELQLRPIKLLNRGGGFVSKDGPGLRFVSNSGPGVNFVSAATAINEALNKYSVAVQVIAELRRYFSEEAVTLATRILGSRLQTTTDANNEVCGSMNCLLYDRPTVTVHDMTDVEFYYGDRIWNKDCIVAYKSLVLEPTCDEAAIIIEHIWIRQLQCGHWLVFPRMGAYYSDHNGSVPQKSFLFLCTVAKMIAEYIAVMVARNTCPLTICKIVMMIQRTLIPDVSIQFRRRSPHCFRPRKAIARARL